MFHPLDAGQIRDYLAKVNPLDKAGAYAIQEHGDMIISEMSGSYSNVVGLPVERLKGGNPVMGSELTEAQRIYDQLWSKTSTALESGGLRIDPLLRGKTGDPRRGATLVARPNAGVQKRVETFLRKAAAICPGQHFYKPAELHVTVLAVIPGSESWRKEVHRLPVCRTVLDKVLKNCRAFSVKFRGVTVSPEAVLVQGFPQDETLRGFATGCGVRCETVESAKIWIAVTKSLRRI